MKEIVSIQIGKSGNNIGCEFWRLISMEGAVFENPFFEETTTTTTAQTTRVARSVCVDLDRESIDRIGAGDLGRMFRPECLIAGQVTEGFGWARGHYTDGAEMSEQVLDSVRRRAEGCDHLQGFEMIHGIGEGCGGGLGTLLLSRIREEFPDKVMSAVSVIPGMDEFPMEPYNVVLSLGQLIENADVVACIDNPAMERAAKRSAAGRESAVSFRDLNRIAAAAMSEATCSLRFRCDSNQDLRKLATNLVPFPRAHFLICGISPIGGPPATEVKTTTELVSDVLRTTESMTATVDPTRGRMLSASLAIRGDIGATAMATTATATAMAMAMAMTRRRRRKRETGFRTTSARVKSESPGQGFDGVRPSSETARA